MMVHQLLTLLTAALLISPAKEYERQKPGDASVTFTVSNAGFDVTGSIGLVQKDIKFDPHDLANSSVIVTASPSTISTGIALRDRHLQKLDYFATEKYPFIVMRSKSFRRSGTKKCVGNFDLTIKDITRPVVFVFSGTPEGNIVRYKGHMEINRQEFKLGESSVILDDLVEIDVEVVL